MITNELDDYPAEYEKMPEKKGRGWHGDSHGHARAGQIGGLRAAANRRKSNPELVNKSKKR